MVALTSRRAALATDSDAGFSLVEMLVYIVLSALALAVLSSIMLNGLRTQKTVQSIDNATGVASLVSRSVEQGIGNADGVGTATAFSVTAATPAGQLLQARTAASTTAGIATWRCQAWYYSATNAAFYTATSTSGAVALPANTAALSSWVLLGSGVSAPSGIAFTATSSTLLKLTLTVSSTGAPPVVVATTDQTTPSDSTGSPSTCF